MAFFILVDSGELRFRVIRYRPFIPGPPVTQRIVNQSRSTQESQDKRVENYLALIACLRICFPRHRSTVIAGKVVDAVCIFGRGVQRPFHHVCWIDCAFLRELTENLPNFRSESDEGRITQDSSSSAKPGR